MNTFYCNPLPLPDYPRGVWCRPSRQGNSYGWMHATRSHFREAADPTALYHDGTWYLYVSAGAVYTSRDFEHWEHHTLPELPDDYDPRVFTWRSKFYLTASRAPVWEGDSPLGPWKPLGPVLLPDGSPVYTGKSSADWGAPAWLHDDDGRLYAYWGIGEPGIFVAEADPVNPARLLTEPEIIFAYDPAHRWERFGDLNEDASTSYVEGPWVFKRQGRYFVVYAAPGTEWKTYAMGYYYSDSPTGPFHYHEGNPFILKTDGFVHGTGHGCVSSGPNDEWWCFYTCLVRSEHNFERRVGVDRLHFNAENHIAPVKVTESPQFLDGRPGLIPVSVNRHTRASSHTPGREPVFANDHVQRTWWEPAPDDSAPWIEIDLVASFSASAVRLCWHESGLDYDDPQRRPVPVKWRLLGRNEPGADWRILHDATDNDTDFLIDIRHFDPVTVRQIRLELIRSKTGPRIGITDLTVFADDAQIPPAR